MNVVVVIVLTLVLGFSVFRYGGVLPEDWNYCLLAIGLVTPVSLILSRRNSTPRLDRISRCLLLSVSAVAALQLVPLPVSVLSWLSPARAKLVPFGLGWAPLTATQERTAYFLLTAAGCVLVFLIVRDLQFSLRERLWAAAWPLIAIAALEAILGLVQYYTASAGGSVVARGTYVNRNHFAGFLEMVLPFAFMYGVAIVRRKQSPYESPAMPAVKSCVLFGATTVILLGVLHSLSRMGFMATLAALFVMGALALGSGRRSWRRWLPVSVVAVLVILGFILLPNDPLIARFADLATTEDISGDTRAQVWNETMALVKAFPVFGCGLGGYESCFRPYKTVAPMQTADFAHNDYLQYLAEFGIVGFGVALALLLRIFGGALRAVVVRPPSDARYLALAVVGSFTAVLAHSFVDFNLYIPSNMMALAWVAGIASTFLRSGRRRTRSAEIREAGSQQPAPAGAAR